MTLEILYPESQPEEIIRHFEVLLPYALVLNVSKTWANAFADYAAKAGVAELAKASMQANGLYGLDINRMPGRFERASYPQVERSTSGGIGGGSFGSGSGGRGSSGGGAGGGGGRGW